MAGIFLDGPHILGGGIIPGIIKMVKKKILY